MWSGSCSHMRVRVIILHIIFNFHPALISSIGVTQLERDDLNLKVESEQGDDGDNTYFTGRVCVYSSNAHCDFCRGCLIWTAVGVFFYSHTHAAIQIWFQRSGGGEKMRFHCRIHNSKRLYTPRVREREREKSCNNNLMAPHESSVCHCSFFYTAWTLLKWKGKIMFPRRSLIVIFVLSADERTGAVCRSINQKLSASILMDVGGYGDFFFNIGRTYSWIFVMTSLCGTRYVFLLSPRFSICHIFRWLPAQSWESGAQTC